MLDFACLTPPTLAVYSLLAKDWYGVLLPPGTTACSIKRACLRVYRVTYTSRHA